MLGACSTTFNIWQVSIMRLSMLPMSNKMELQEGSRDGEEIMQIMALESLLLNWASIKCIYSIKHLILIFKQLLFTC